MQAAGKQQKLARWQLPALGLAVTLVVLLPLFFLQSVMQSSLAASQMVDHTRQVETVIHSLSYDIRDIEAATFALAAGIDTPLIRSRLADSNARIPAQFEQLAALTIDNPVQQRRIGELKAILDRRQDVTRRLLDGGDTADFRRAAEEVVTRFPIRGMAGDIAGEELRLLSQRVATAERLRRQGEQLIWVTMAVQLLLAGLIVWMAQRQIGRRLQVESELLQASARAQSVLQTVREPIVLVDGNQRVVMHNVAFAELYSEATSDDLQGRELTSIGGGAWRDPVLLQRLNDVMFRGRELWDYEHHQRTTDESERVMLVNARRMPLPDRDDRVVLVTISDVTARKASENHVRELNRQLEGKIEQVSDVNRELEAFSYSVSHDLRAPLRHIAGFADKLGRHLGDRADERTDHYIDVIGSSAKRMSALIDDLLVYSRLGRTALRLQAVDMQSLVDETRALLDANVASDTPGRRIEWRIAPLPMLVGDENMLRQVWLNLLGNAVKYSAGRELARIEVEHQRLDNDDHHFSVRDNGAGFDMQYAGKLFGVFQRMHKASEYPGTGIGLASVRRVILRHGGRVWAEAEPHAGATFHFVIPATLDTPAQEPNQ